MPEGAEGSLQKPLLPPHRSPWTMLATTGSPPRDSGESSSRVLARRAAICSPEHPPALDVSFSMCPSRCSSQKSAQSECHGRFGWKVAPMVLSTGNPKGLPPLGETPARCILARATPNSNWPLGPAPQNSRYSKRAKARLLLALSPCVPKAIGAGTRMVEVSAMAFTPSYSARSMSYPFRADLIKYLVFVSGSTTAPVVAPPPPAWPPPVVGFSLISLPTASDAALETVSRKVAEEAISVAVLVGIRAPGLATKALAGRTKPPPTNGTSSTSTDASVVEATRKLVAAEAILVRDVTPR
mmetsp:Transcript_16458/g.33819  ORF Transcript_16458/g.33819 Transcript_16458/m.33819 type:complete len:298 (+) Transcript_16458:1555-2448(+)